MDELNHFYISPEINPELFNFVEDKFQKEMTFQEKKYTNLPKIHLGIIPDGNRRWCKSHKKNSLEFGAMIQHMILRMYHQCLLQQIPDLFKMVDEISIYVLSKDNLLKRDDGTLLLIEKTLDVVCAILRIDETAKHVKFDVHGDVSLLPIKIQQQIKTCIELSKGTFPIHLAIGYDPITDTKLFLKEGYESRRQIDMVIRSGGQLRSSGFYPLQTLYSEWFYFDTFWPDMTPSLFHDALDQFLSRQRNFGK
jgi:undecaprenyl pyrophosphate synthase